MRTLLVIGEPIIRKFSLCFEFTIWKLFVAGVCEFSKRGYGGHIGDYKAAIIGCETVDKVVKV